MRTLHDGLVIDALDYELLAIGNDPARPELGRFADVHLHDEAPVWRLASGYLSLTTEPGTEPGAEPGAERGAEPGAERGTSVLTVRSHGHAVATIDAGPDGVEVVFAETAAPATIAGDDAGADGDGDDAGAAADGDAPADGVLRSPGGIALLADGGLRWTRGADLRTARIASSGAWGFTIVHGPAAAKVENRLRLAASLRRVGGRNG